MTTAELADRLGGSGLVIIDIDDVSSGPGQRKLTVRSCRRRAGVTSRM
ncbi:hypothetical protein [Mycobacteroides abscessus]|nr:hypothetical protein [Mycobacteroides abscessus]